MNVYVVVRKWEHGGMQFVAGYFDQASASEAAEQPAPSGQSFFVMPLIMMDRPNG